MGSAWMTASRCGYFAKTLAYPGCLMLAALYMAAWARPTVGRIVAVCLLGPVVALYIHPVLPVLVLGLLLAGSAAALTLGRSCRDSVHEEAAHPVPTSRLPLRAALVYAAVTAPAFLWHLLTSEKGFPPSPL